MERIFQDEGAINFHSHEHGNADKSSETPPRNNYQGVPAMRYGLSPRSDLSVGGTSEINRTLGQDNAQKSAESLTERNCLVFTTKDFEALSENSSMKGTSEILILPNEGSTEGSSEKSPPKRYQGSPTMRYRALRERSSSKSDGAERSSETQSEELANEKGFSMIAASEDLRPPHQFNEHRNTQTLFDKREQRIALTGDHASIEKSFVPAPEKSSQAFFKPGNCPYPYLDFPKQHVDLRFNEPVKEKQEPHQDVQVRLQDSEVKFQSSADAKSQAHVFKSAHDFFQSSNKAKVRQQASLEEHMSTTFARGDFAEIASTFTRMQKLETEFQSRIIEKVSENIQYTAVMELMRGLRKGYSKQNFQVELQKLLTDARKAQRHAKVSRKVVPGRCELCRPVEEEVLASMNFPIAATTSVWKMAGAFAHREEVVRHLSVLDELLALPPNSSLKAALDCRVESHVEPSSAQLWLSLHTLHFMTSHAANSA